MRKSIRKKFLQDRKAETIQKFPLFHETEEYEAKEAEKDEISYEVRTCRQWY